jgi:tetratricopeptide (TPR) repeat protein
MQPQRPEALAGAAHLANVLADEAEAAEASGDLDSARQLIDEVQSLQPTQPKLPGLQARLQQLESSPAALDARDRGRLDRAAKNIVRAQEDLGHQPLDFKAVDDATDQYDKALAAAPKAPGLPSLKERLIVAYAIAIQTALDLHDTKRAQKLITNAHKRNWSSPELDQLETTLQGGSATTAGIKEAGTH